MSNGIFLVTVKGDHDDYHIGHVLPKGPARSTLHSLDRPSEHMKEGLMVAVFAATFFNLRELPVRKFDTLKEADELKVRIPEFIEYYFAGINPPAIIVSKDHLRKASNDHGVRDELRDEIGKVLLASV